MENSDVCEGLESYLKASIQDRSLDSTESCPRFSDSNHDDVAHARRAFQR